MYKSLFVKSIYLFCSNFSFLLHFLLSLPQILRKSSKKNALHNSFSKKRKNRTFMKKILIFGNTYRPKSLPPMQPMLSEMRHCGLHAAIDAPFAQFLQQQKGLDLSGYDIIEGDDFMGDMAFSFGGDGTLLNTAARIGSKEIPILGINTGHLGFLAGIARSDIAAFITDIAAGNYKIDRRTLLHVRTSDGTLLKYPFALNELSVLKQDSSSMIAITVTIDEEPLSTYLADGLLITTPTGSTAYALSVGGPIIAPNTPTMLITPVASHSLTMRPLIISDSCCVKLQVCSRSQSYRASLDGQSHTLPISTQLSVEKADYQVLIAQSTNQTFFKTLKEKLMWGIDSRD